MILGGGFGAVYKFFIRSLELQQSDIWKLQDEETLFALKGCETCPLSVLEFKQRGTEVILSMMKRGLTKKDIWLTDIGDFGNNVDGPNLANLFGGDMLSNSNRNIDEQSHNNTDTTQFITSACFEELKKNKKRLWRYMEEDIDSFKENESGNTKGGSLRFSKNLIVHRRTNYSECFFEKLQKHYEVIHKPILKFWGDNIQ